MMTHKGMRLIGISMGLWIGMAGCHRKPAAPPVTTKIGKSARAAGLPPPPLSAEQLALKPNEAGVVPVLMYHSIDTKAIGKHKPDERDSLARSPEGFRKEIQKMYDNGYRPVTLHEYLDNKIDIPLGKSPVILTFDDSRKSQFNYLPDGSIDPNCAIGILQEFSHAHPDWPVKATFFVQPVPGTRTFFGQPDSSDKKLEELVKMGCEVQNHTLTHPFLRRLSDERVQKEIAGCQVEIQKVLPQAKVDILALPYGVWPHNRKLALDGQYEGVRYHNRAVLLVGYRPAPAAIAKRFDSKKIMRIQAAGSGENTSAVWLEQIKTDGERYVSDGDPAITTIPKHLLSKIDPKRLNGSVLRTY